MRGWSYTTRGSEDKKSECRQELHRSESGSRKFSSEIYNLTSLGQLCFQNLLTGPQAQLDSCWLQPPLGTACRAGHGCGPHTSQLCRTIDYFLPLAAGMSPSGLWYSKRKLWVRSSPIPLSLVSEAHGVFSNCLQLQLLGGKQGQQQ